MRIQVRKTGKWDLRVDKRNTHKMRKIITRYGWPTVYIVGKKASRNAWLIVQHSDHNIRFQKYCLNLMKRELSKNPASVFKTGIAYLTDRILIKSGKKQLFGTQFKRHDNGALTLQPIIRKKDVNKRRKDYGMETLEKYVKKALKIK